MSIYINAIDGPFKGKSFLIKPGYTIGRRRGEILLDDTKVSSSHAKVEEEGPGKLLLIDLGSSNGIRLDGTKKPKISLTDGVIFQLGRSRFQVIEERRASAEPGLGVFGSWQELLSAKLKSHAERLSDVNKNLNYFNPPFRLEFLQGIQADESLVIGYGPRMAGSGGAADIALWEPGCPEIGFRLRPNQKHRAEFINMAPDFIKLNGSPVDQHELQDGDLITMGYTTIKVSFVEE